MKYFVSAQNQAGTAGERPLIEADSPEEAEEIYKSFGTGYEIISIEVA